MYSKTKNIVCVWLKFFKSLLFLFTNDRPRRQSDEPSAMKMIAVVGMSAVILAMILITMLVVIVMPVGMLLMMLYENCVEYAINNSEFQSDKDNPIDIMAFFAVQAFRYFINIDFNSIVWNNPKSIRVYKTKLIVE